MAVAEALARGLPVVSTKTGAIADLVGGHGGDCRAAGRRAGVRAGLVERAGRDSGVRQRLAAGARQVRDRLPTWDDAASRMDAVLSRVPG